MHVVPAVRTGRASFFFYLITALMLVFFSPSLALAGSKNHFKNSSPDALTGDDDDGLYTPLEFEAAMASRPNASSQVFVSRCRYAPFNNSVNFYTPFTGTNTTDAIVNDTTFSFAD